MQYLPCLWHRAATHQRAAIMVCRPLKNTVHSKAAGLHSGALPGAIPGAGMATTPFINLVQSDEFKVSSSKCLVQVSNIQFLISNF